MYQDTIYSRDRGKVGAGKTVGDADVPERIIQNCGQGIGFGMNQEFSCGFGLHNKIAVEGWVRGLEELADNGASITKRNVGKNFVGCLGKRVGEKILGMCCKSGVFFDGNDVGSNFE